jgi:acyl-CoA synthetase (NDP forming)
MIVGEGGYRSTLVFLTQVGGSSRMGPQIRRELKEVMGRHPDRLYAVSIVADQEVVSAFEADGFLVYEEPTRAVAALAAMGRLGQAFAGVAPAAPLDVPAVAFPASAPNEAEGKRLLASAGIATAPDRVCRTAEETVAAAEALGYPVVVKILSPDIVHKTEVGGVLLDLRDPGAVAEAFEHVVRSVRVHAPEATLDGVLVGRQLSGGVECMMGIQRDPVFGPVAVFGLGGIWVELFRDVAMRRCPFGEEEARRLILSVRGAELLRGVRGREPADVAALAAMLSKLSMVGAQAPRHVASMDLNPVLALPEGQGAFALDAAIAYGRVESGSLPDGHVRTGEAGGEGGE